MPTGPGILWERTSEGSAIWKKNVMTDGHSFQAQQWLSYLQDNDPDLEIDGSNNRVQIQCKFFRGEHIVKNDGKRKWTVDGMAQTQKGHPKFYEYLGCNFHRGCPVCDPTGKDDFFEKKAEFLREFGPVWYIYECQWKALLKEIEDKETKSLPHVLEKKHTDEEILSSIKDDRLFGYLIVDIMTPPELIETYKNFPPIIKKFTITDDALSPYMAERWRKRSPGLKLSRETVIQCFNATEHLIMTPLVKHYLAIGLKITKIHKIVQYQPAKALAPFVTRVTEMRLEAERSKKMTKANSAKIFGNSGYGKVYIILFIYFIFFTY